MKKYIVSPITTWDQEAELWQTQVGLNTPSMPLHFIVCDSKTREKCRERAINLAKLLNLEWLKIAKQS